MEDPATSIVQSRKSVEDGFDAALHLLETVPNLTGIVAVSDVHAAGAIQAVRRSGRRVPEDVSVVGYDDTPGAIYTMPPLTSVRMPWEEAGVRAAEVVLARLADERLTPIHENLACRLVVRGSSGGPIERNGKPQ